MLRAVCARCRFARRDTRHGLRAILSRLRSHRRGSPGSPQSFRIAWSKTLRIACAHAAGADVGRADATSLIAQCLPFPFEYRSRLKDEERRRVPRFDAPAINPPQDQRFEVVDARRANQIRRGPASASTVDVTVASLLTRHHHYLPTGLGEVPRGGCAFSRLADDHRMPISNGLRNVLRHSTVDAFAHKLFGTWNVGHENHGRLLPLSERRNASICRRSCALRRSGSSSLWPAGASGARL